MKDSGTEAQPLLTPYKIEKPKCTLLLRPTFGFFKIFPDVN
jgi:hypothetical protein